METHFDCIACFVRQTVEAVRVLELDNGVANNLLRRVLGLLKEMDWTLPPPVIGRDVHRIIREILGDEDPYLRAKIADTESALALLPKVEEAVGKSEDPFETAVGFSIAGNAIDLGAKSGLEQDVHKTFLGALNKSLDETALGGLKEAISRAKNVLFLADNAGELVFDRPLLDFIGPKKVTVVVRGSPIINDATMDDATRSGLTVKFRVISNGSDTPGTWLEDCSEEFVRHFESADLVVSKGQGNYETLCDNKRPIHFLLLTKCPIVSKQIGIPLDRYVIKNN